MTRKQRPNNIGKRRELTSIDGKRLAFIVEDEIVLPQSKGKLIYFQKMRWEKGKRLEYRFTYYMKGVKPGKRGQWVFGQYSLMIPAKYLSTLLEKARNRGWEGV